MQLPALVLNQLKWNSYLSREHKLLYVATPKVACTSLKWWFAELVGCAEEISHRIDSSESDPQLIVHDTFFKVAPTVTGLDLNSLQEALDSDDYFKFCVVRNPFARTFSAWQSKWLLQEPLQVDQYIDIPFMNLPIKTAADITNAFECFLEHIYLNESPSFLDVHVTPQVELLCPAEINYTTIAQIEDISLLQQRLSQHLGPAYHEPFVRRKSNESLMPYQQEFFSERSITLIREMYSGDFDRFKYNNSLPPNGGCFNSDQFNTAIKAIHLVRGRQSRISEIRKTFTSKLEEHQKALAQLMDRYHLLLHQQTTNLSSQSKFPSFTYKPIANELEDIAALLTNILTKKDNDLEQQCNKISSLENNQKMIHEELIRAEAQLDLLKDVMLNDIDIHRF